MLKKYLLLLVAVLGGGGGLLLRRVHLQNGFEADTGLPIPGAFSTSMIAIYVLVLVALLLILSISAGRTEISPAITQERRKTPILALLCFTASAALSLAAAIMDFRSLQVYVAQTQYEPRMAVMLFLFAALTVLAGAGIFLIGLQHHRGKSLAQSGLLLLPAFSCCLWLLYSYQHWVSDPIVGDYIFALFAIMSGMLAHYFIASQSYQKPRATLLLLFTSIAIFLSFLSLSYGDSMTSTFLFTAQILYFVPSLLLYFDGRFATVLHPSAELDADAHGEDRHLNAKEENP